MDEAGAAPRGLEAATLTRDSDDTGDLDAASVRVDRTAAAIYGTIVAGSVLAVGAGHSTVGQTSLAVVVTVLVYWLAESYAHALAIRLTGASPTHRAHVRQHLRRTGTIVTASFAPLAAMLLAAAPGADTKGAITAALGFTTAWLGVLAWVAARRAGCGGCRSPPQPSAAA